MFMHSLGTSSDRLLRGSEGHCTGVIHSQQAHGATKCKCGVQGSRPSAPPTDGAVHPSAAIRAVHVVRAPLRVDR
jgi:hypothetical protein